MSDHAKRVWPSVKAATEILLVPIGSTEQHGHHLPFNTDTTIAAALAKAASEVNNDTLVAPAVAYGASGEHQDFPGTLSIGTTVLSDLLVELGRSALPSFSYVVFVNGHGGNSDAVNSAVSTLRYEGRNASGWSPTFGEAHRADGHAGHTETSLLLYLEPNAVRSEAAATGNTEPIDTLWPSLKADGVREHSPTGVLGDPTGASPEHGRELFEHLVESLNQHLGQLRSSRPS